MLEFITLIALLDLNKVFHKVVVSETGNQVQLKVVVDVVSFAHLALIEREILALVTFLCDEAFKLFLPLELELQQDAVFKSVPGLLNRSLDLLLLSDVHRPGCRVLQRVQ